MTEWSIRSLLNPVITRLLIYNVNPIDVEYVLTVVENKNHLNMRSIQKTWVEEWEKKAFKYKALAEEAEKKNNYLSARQFYFLVTQSYYAIFLINLENLEDKKRIYNQYAFFFRKSTEYFSSKVEYLEVSLDDNSIIPGYLHHPVETKKGKKSCVVIYSGLGSCKEEMNTLARPIVERGIAVFVPDMPGNGEAVFSKNVKCRISNLNAAFTKILDTLEKREDIQKGAFGVYGLCMGGGYAYRAACMDKRYAFCATLFPLFITQVDNKTIPKWMKHGDWYNYQTGGIPSDEFMNEMQELEKGELDKPFLFIHGKYDNWMKLEVANELFERANGKKDKIIVEDEPVFSNHQVVTHTMPVGEQLHWIRHAAADWMVERFNEIEHNI